MRRTCRAFACLVGAACALDAPATRRRALDATRGALDARATRRRAIGALAPVIATLCVAPAFAADSAARAQWRAANAEIDSILAQWDEIKGRAAARTAARRDGAATRLDQRGPSASEPAGRGVARRVSIDGDRSSHRRRRRRHPAPPRHRGHRARSAASMRPSP